MQPAFKLCDLGRKGRADDDSFGNTAAKGTARTHLYPRHGFKAGLHVDAQAVVVPAQSECAHVFCVAHGVSHAHPRPMNHAWRQGVVNDRAAQEPQCTRFLVH